MHYKYMLEKWGNPEEKQATLMEASKQEPKEIVANPPKSFEKRKKWTKLDKDVACSLFLVHLLSMFAPFYFNWSAFCVAFALYVLTGLFGISVSYHRNLAHKSFTLPKWLEYLFAYCGAHALQGDPIDWVNTHRAHHRFVDTERDPHSPIQGFWFSHITWLIDSYSLTKRVCPKYFTDFQKIERNIFVMFSKHGKPDNVGDLEKQTFYRFIHKTYFLHPIILAILLYAYGGAPFLIWGMGVRIVVVLHITCMINSVCHIWGTKPWRTGDLSRNNWWVSLLSFGEGWHNNHHAFEYSARHGLEWWQIDFGWYVVMFLEAAGIATHVKVPSQNQKQKLAMDSKPEEE